MKDFYYILGLPQNASAGDVKKAYRKLVQKFHPDKNDGDAFFAERFQEIQEAYDTLGNDSRRTIYDAERKGHSSAGASNGATATALSIDFFRSDKSAFAYGEAVTFYWKTSGASKVVMKPFGQVSAAGEKTYRLKDFKNESLSFQLLAERTGSSKQVRATITLRNETYHELYQFFKRKITNESGRKPSASGYKISSTSNRKSTTRSGRNEQLYASVRIVLLILAILMVILLIVFVVMP